MRHVEGVTMPSLDFEAEETAFREFYDGQYINLDGALTSFKTLIRSLLATKQEIAVADVEGRVKNREECLSKFNRKYRTILEKTKTPYLIRDNITDLIGLRVVCLYEDDVEKIRELISSEFLTLNVTDKTAQIEGTENSFGYKGLHLDLKLDYPRTSMPEYQNYAEYPFELQIRTIVQDSWSVIDHKIKYKKSIPNDIKRRINTLAALFELADREFRAIRDATLAEIERAKTIYPEIEAETPGAVESINTSHEPRAEPDPGRYAPLNAFNFLKIANHFFPGFEFEPHKIDGFTQEVINLKPNISRGKFNFYMRECIGKVKKFQAHLEAEGDGDKMNPFTIMRHCLYAGDKLLFSSMLTDAARAKFDSWMSTQ